MNLRDALAQSRNVPAVKLLYLVGIQDSIKTAQNTGISTLTDPARYGLTLVLGGGEVKLLEMTSAYATFATEGIRRNPTGILEITDQNGTVLESFRDSGNQAIPKEVAIKINDVLSDNVARTPLWGSRSFMYHPGYSVAGKTGTTDNKVDAWMVGYSPDIAVGVWSGNNDNTPMGSGSGISGSLWGEFMSYALSKTEATQFTPNTAVSSLDTKPIIRGQWLGGESVFIDSVSGKLATALTPNETKKEVIITNPHSILHWVDKKNPLGEYPNEPNKDNQYNNWEYSVLNWWGDNGYLYPKTTEADLPTDFDDIHTEENLPQGSFVTPTNNQTISYGDTFTIQINYTSPINADLLKIDFFVGGTYLGTARNNSKQLTTSIDSSMIQAGSQSVQAIIYDEYYNQVEISQNIQITNE
jgi:membrane carboxypeptidase/penicillin-binding protein PbpC